MKVLLFGTLPDEELNRLIDQSSTKPTIHALVETIEETMNHPAITYYTDSSKLDTDYTVLFFSPVPYTHDHGVKSFYKFHKKLCKLNNYLQKDGHLVVYNCDYSLEDTILKEYYEKVQTPVYTTVFTTIHFSTVEYRKLSDYTCKYAVLWASTGNLGDDVQTLAAIHYLKKNSITEYTYINREELRLYNGPPVFLLMNGWFTHFQHNFPQTVPMIPIFVSFHCAYESLIADNKDYFKSYEPIGCRDTATVELFKKHGIKAYFTGCLTLTFDKESNKTNTTYLVDINTCWNVEHVLFNKSAYPNAIELSHNMYDTAIQVNISKRLELATELLNKYRTANLVITPRLHCALPCRAFNTHVQFIHSKYKSEPRFSGLHSILAGSESIDTASITINPSLLTDIVRNFNNCLV